MESRLPALLRLVLLGALATQGANAQDLSSPRWLHPGADRVRHLSSEYTECVDLSGPPARHALVEAGRLLFRHSRIGDGSDWKELSCESCHAGGRARTDFHLQQRSAAPGSVDLDLADGFDPRPIPFVLDLVPGPALERRLAEHLERGLGGGPQSAHVLEALSAYLGALSSSWCRDAMRSPVSVASVLYEITRMINSMQYYLKVENEFMSERMLEILRQDLRALAARFEGVAGLAGEVADFEHQLKVGQVTHLSGAWAERRRSLRSWHRRWLAFAPRLPAAEGESLYDRDRLEAWLRGH